MSERDDYPAGVPCWVDTLQPDPGAALAFYGEVLGWEPAGPGDMPGGPGGDYFVGRLGGRDVAGIGALHGAGGDGATPAWTTYVAVTSADDAAARVEPAGGRVLMGPFDVAPAGRMAVIEDPAGAALCLWEAGLRRGAQLVNEPGAWSMSLLSTPDPDAAIRFYGAVFGWEAEPYGDGAWLWRLPGYVGGEPRQPVPRDVVAVLLRGDGPPAGWAVDFWVDDADAVARAAATLGGAVVVPPQDGPVSRQAVIADPQGAVLSVTTVPAAAR